MFIKNFKKYIQKKKFETKVYQKGYKRIKMDYKIYQILVSLLIGCCYIDGSDACHGELLCKYHRSFIIIIILISSILILQRMMTPSLRNKIFDHTLSKIHLWLDNFLFKFWLFFSLPNKFHDFILCHTIWIIKRCGFLVFASFDKTSWLDSGG